MAVLSDAQREAGWTVVKLGDIVTCLDHLRQPIKGLDRVPGPYPYYGASGVVDYIDQYAIDGKYLLISEDGENLRSRSLPIAFYAVGKSWVNNHAHIISASDSVMAYVKYVLNSHDVSAYLTGTTMPKLSQKSMMLIDIPLPPQDILERIARILGSLDDKIEANTRLIQTLEDYIHAMIVKISKSDSLKRVAIKDLAVHEKNQELPREHVEGVIHHYSLPAYDSGKTPGIEEADSIKSNKFIIDKPCVLFSKLNPGTPRIWLVNPEEGIKSYASTEFIVLTPKESVDIASLWAACSEERISQNLADMASGTSTSHQRVRPADVLNSKVLDLNDQSEIRSITSYIEALRKENLQLAATRDALIKRLIG